MKAECSIDFYSIFDKKHIDGMRLKPKTKPRDERYFLVSSTTCSKLRRAELEKSLEVAKHYNAIDSDIIKRLQSKKESVFYQTYQELMVAYFLQKHLEHQIEYYPLGKNGSRLDMAIIPSNKERILIEVKSYFSPGPLAPYFIGVRDDNARILQNIKAAVRQLPSDTTNVIILAGEGNFNISDDLCGLYEALKRVFSPKQNRRVSAVATFERYIPWPPQEIKYDFKVCHNPFARNKIDREIFKTFRQFNGAPSPFGIKEDY